MTGLEHPQRYTDLMRLAWLVGSVLVVGCAGTGDSASQRKPDRDKREFVGSDAMVAREVLVFEDPAEAERFDRARSCWAERGAEWEHYGLRKIGNFVQENWCTGPSAERGCSGGNFRSRDGAQWASVGTLHYPRNWPAVFGVQVAAGVRVADGQWSVSMSGSTNGASILGDSGHIRFRKSETVVVSLGTGYRWEVADSEFMIATGDDAWTLLDRVRQSPEALADEALSRWRELEHKVVAALEADQVEQCVYGEYKGRGIPPECERRIALPPDAKQTELARIKTHVEALQAVLATEADTLHAALVGLAPTSCL